MPVQLHKVLELERQAESARLQCEAQGVFRIKRVDLERLDREIACESDAVSQRFGVLGQWVWWVPLLLCTARVFCGRAVIASGLPLLAVGLLAAVLGLGVTLIIGLMLDLPQVLTIILGVVVCSATGLGLVAVLVATDEAAAKKTCLDILKWKEELNQEQLRIGGLLRERRALYELLRARESFEDLAAQAANLRHEYECAANQLAMVDWRGLRGIEFENYLATVFRFHRFDVATTRTTGDQGIDLVAISPSVRLAIQVKGYESSVGNDAVQQAFAGKKHYERIHACQFTHSVVITNSVFTKSAKELAVSVDCLLIDETRMPDLIAGRIFAGKRS